MFSIGKGGRNECRREQVVPVAHMRPGMIFGPWWERRLARPHKIHRHVSPTRGYNERRKLGLEIGMSVRWCKEGIPVRESGISQGVSQGSLQDSSVLWTVRPYFLYSGARQRAWLNEVFVILTVQGSWDPWARRRHKSATGIKYHTSMSTMKDGKEWREHTRTGYFYREGEVDALLWGEWRGINEVPSDRPRAEFVTSTELSRSKRREIIGLGRAGTLCRRSFAKTEL